MPATSAYVARSRTQLADEFFSHIPALKQRFAASLPSDLSEELSRVTPHQLEALHYLLRLRGAVSAGVSMNELARAQHCAMSTATALADRLIRQGLAERIQDPADRRVVRIAPTPEGTELTRRFDAARRGIALRALAPLTDSEVETLVALLAKVASASPDAADD